MLLTISTTHHPATDLGYLLHKNPSRLHSIELSFGKAHIFYPEADAEKCTAALLLDVDPVGLVRGKPGRRPHIVTDHAVPACYELLDDSPANPARLPIISSISTRWKKRCS